MPERIFFGLTLTELDDKLAQLQGDVAGGQIEEQRAAGVTTRVKPNSNLDIRRLIFSVRWEMYMVARKLIRQKLCQGVPCDDPTIQGLREDYPNPARENKMAIPTFSGVGVYAPIPPELPPLPKWPANQTE